MAGAVALGAGADHQHSPLGNATGAAVAAVASSVGGYAATHTDGLVAIALACAVAVVFAGRTLLRPALFLLAGFLPTFLYFEGVGYQLFLPADAGDAASAVAGAPTAVVAGVTAVALLLGVLAGVVMLRLLFTPAVFLLTAASGVVAVLVVHHLLFQSPATPGGIGDVIFVTVAIVAALLFGMMSLIYPRTMVIIGTSFDGAAVTAYALAYFLGNQPTIFDIDAPPDKTPWWTVGYTVATVILGFYGAFIQLRVAAADTNHFRHHSSNRPSQTTSHRQRPPVSSEGEETDRMLPAKYGAIQGDFAKTNGLGAPPLLSYEDEEAAIGR